MSKSQSPQPRRALHGRRKGRPLRGLLQRLLEEDLAAVAIPLPTGAGQLDPRALFDDRVDEVWLEIGFGGGEHLVWQAAHHPGVGLLGAEIFVNGVAKALRALKAEPAAQARIHQGDARDLLEALAPASLSRAFILFPDPWPKARHNKRRLVQSETLDQLARVLRPGSELRLATDDADYAAWMLACLDSHPAFRWTARKADDWRLRPDDWPETRYEQKGRLADRPPVFLRWLRVEEA
ncbi:MAG: tRNA (guanosine(46)-N7)-methyltransferase TrmB [Rhodospirillales bacterium]